MSDAQAAFAEDLQSVLADLGNMLLEKNRKYGDSALDPMRVFSRADPVEQIRVRLDDKLSRLARGVGEDEDVERDVMGYLVLLRIAKVRGLSKVQAVTGASRAEMLSVNELNALRASLHSESFVQRDTTRTDLVSDVVYELNERGMLRRA